MVGTVQNRLHRLEHLLRQVFLLRSRGGCYLRVSEMEPELSGSRHERGLANLTMHQDGKMLLELEALTPPFEPFIHVLLEPVGHGLVDFGVNPTLALGIVPRSEADLEKEPEVTAAHVPKQLGSYLGVPAVVPSLRAHWASHRRPFLPWQRRPVGAASCRAGFS